MPQLDEIRVRIAGDAFFDGCDLIDTVDQVATLERYCDALAVLNDHEFIGLIMGRDGIVLPGLREAIADLRGIARERSEV